MFSKFFYLASLGSYYTFFLIHKFGLTVRNAQLFLFAFMGAVAAGTIIGGPLGDRLNPLLRQHLELFCFRCRLGGEQLTGETCANFQLRPPPGGQRHVESECSV